LCDSAFPVFTSLALSRSSTAAEGGLQRAAHTAPCPPLRWLCHAWRLLPETPPPAAAPSRAGEAGESDKLRPHAGGGCRCSVRAPPGVGVSSRIRKQLQLLKKISLLL
ncbi:hypothetical protein KIL84_013306, partial [Mauremys mutica]